MCRGMGREASKGRIVAASKVSGGVGRKLLYNNNRVHMVSKRRNISIRHEGRLMIT